MDAEFRELTARERDLLEKLLTAAIHGRDELRTQLNHVKAKEIMALPGLEWATPIGSGFNFEVRQRGR